MSLTNFSSKRIFYTLKVTICKVFHKNNFTKLQKVSHEFTKFYKTTSTARLSPPWNICFFGTDEYALTCLRTLYENRETHGSSLVNKLHVVVPSSQLKQCKVEEFAREVGLQCFRWNEFVSSDLQSHNYDVGTVVSFGKLIPNKIIRIFSYGILNVHPSLLPRWRGASPILHTILNGDTETGVSIMEIRPLHFDVGPLLVQSRFSIPQDITYSQLRHFLAQEGSQLLLQTLNDLPRLENLEYEQNTQGITYAHKPSVKNAQLDWQEQSVVDIDRQFRAISEVFKLKSEWDGHTLKLLRMLPPSHTTDPVVVEKLEKQLGSSQIQAGLCCYLPYKDALCVKCKDGWVAFKAVVFKKYMSAKSFHNGYIFKQPRKTILLRSLQNDLNLKPLEKKRLIS